ncbi:hypothetical protein INT45_007873 [Circinella minor]|uniref:Uncharacterized protein n=1 Tax=Circinella minor TaxID=1195481 RepID=A0A8H7RW25_9FUNG|nr:hypothetical protein INT45_007873 [Circinella minor]
MLRKKYDDAIKAGKVWKLASGTIVEEVMRDIAMNKVYEHPIHSMIIDPDDSIYVNKFSEEGLDEIRDYKAVEFDQPLPEKLHNYLYSFEGILAGDDQVAQQVSGCQQDLKYVYLGHETMLQQGL